MPCDAFALVHPLQVEVKEAGGKEEETKGKAEVVTLPEDQMDTESPANTTCRNDHPHS